MKALWPAELAARLRSAARPHRRPRHNPLSVGALYTIGSIVVVLASLFAGPVIVGKHADFIACTGLSAWLWTLSSLALASTITNHLRELPQFPDALLMAPVAPEFLAQRALSFIRINIAKTLAISAVAALGLTAIYGTFAPHRRASWNWWLFLPAAAGLWLHLTLLAAALPHLRPWILRIGRRLPMRLTAALAAAATIATIGMVLIPLFIDSPGGRRWIVPLGNCLHHSLPAAGFLSWPAHPQHPPLWSFLTTTLLAAASLPTLRKLITTLRTPPAISGWNDSLWSGDDPEDEWWDDEQSDEAPAASAPDTDPSPDPLPVAQSPTLIATRLRSLIGNLTPQSPDLYLCHDPSHLTSPDPAPFSFDRKSARWVCIPVALCFLVGHPAAEFIAWLWLGIHLWEFMPAATLHRHLRHQWLDPQPQQWLPLSPRPAWLSFSRATVTAATRGLLLALKIAAAALAFSLAVSLLTAWWPWAAARSTWFIPASWRCALTTALIPATKPAFLWFTAPARFSKSLTPPASLTPPSRWFSRLPTLTASLAALLFSIFALTTAVAPLVWSALQMVSYERGIFSESKAQGGRESGFATDEQHRNREKDPFLSPTTERLNLPSSPQNQKMPSVRRAALATKLSQNFHPARFVLHLAALLATAFALRSLSLHLTFTLWSKARRL